MQLTLKQWFTNAPERRAIINNQRYLLALDPTTGGTNLVPVTILTEENEK